MYLKSLKYLMIVVCAGIVSACQSSTPPQCTPEEIQKGKEIQYVKPEYPEWARENGWEGMVEVMVQIDRKGKVTDAFILKSSGRKVLDVAAVAAAKKSLFQPPTCKGTPLPSFAAIRRYVFRFND